MPEPTETITEKSPETRRFTWYALAMERLLGVVQALSQARDVDTVAAIVRDAARNLTGADGATFVLRDGDQCYYAEENAISPLWKGRRFPMSTCISGWVMLNARPAVIEDIYRDSRIPVDAYRPTFVKSLAMVPIRRNAPIGAIGNYWAHRHLPTQEEVDVLQALADTTSVALENAELYGQLQQKIEALQEQQARIHEQRDALEVFTRALAHDLKEPVRTIGSFTELIENHATSPEKAHEYFHHIRASAARMGMLIDSVFRYTQLDDPEGTTKERCAMDRIVDAVKDNLSLLIREHRATVTASGLPEATANRAQMMQLVQNLVSNAVRHGGAGVAVHVEAQDTPADWQFCVRDNGVGIAPEHAAKIFLPFKRLTNKDDCAGLGLATCRKIVAGHGGSIWCESAGAGAAFYFTLPKNVQVAASRMGASPCSAPGTVLGNGNGAKLANVLLVDDMEPDIEIARVILVKRAGLECNLLVAYDAKEALQLIREATQKHETIDLVLLDINMPGMDGFELLEYMRKDPEMSGIAVAMCTGSSYDKDKERAEALGAIGYIIKPPSFDALKPLIAQLTALRLQKDGARYKLLHVAP